MKYCISKPSSYLSKFVKHYWTMESCVHKGVPHVQRIVPNGLLELMFYFDEKPISNDSSISINENTILTGQLSKYYDIKITGKLSLFSILFQPDGLAVFLDIPINELHNQNVPLKYIFKNKTDELETKLAEAPSFQRRINIVEKYLINLIGKNSNIDNYQRINESINLINQTKGLVSIDSLASEACYSRRQFERVFSNHVGTSPKKFLKTIRFQNAVHNSANDKSANLSDITYNCGYYDQSHMINDFQKLTGMPPKQYFKASEPYSDYFQI